MMGAERRRDVWGADEEKPSTPILFNGTEGAGLFQMGWFFGRGRGFAEVRHGRSLIVVVNHFSIGDWAGEESHAHV